jgi:hypothetical protein
LTIDRGGIERQFTRPGVPMYHGAMDDIDLHINNLMFRCFCILIGAPFALFGMLLLYVAVDQWIVWYGDSSAWIIMPSEILAPIGGASLLFGSGLLFFVFRSKASWPSQAARPSFRRPASSRALPPQRD